MAVYQSYAIKAAVGSIPGSKNDRADVEIVQKLLNEHAARGGYQKLTVNGIYSTSLVEAIKMFQRRIVGLNIQDGRVDPNGATLRKLNEPVGTPAAAGGPSYSDVYSHPDANKVKLSYGPNAVRLNDKAEFLLKSILASCGMTGATLTSTLRTYQDQARITLTQTMPNKGEATVKQWYGQDVVNACKKFEDDIDGLAKWWKEFDEKQGKASSKHLTNQAMDVVPSGDRAKFADKVKELQVKQGTGVLRIIPKGVMHEPVDHVEFVFKVTG